MISEIDAILARNLESCAEALAPATTWPLLPNQIFQVLEVFNYQNYCLNANKYFVKDGTTLSCEYESFTLDDFDSFVPELEEYLATTFASDEELTEEQGMELDERHNAQFQKWFASCWEKAGGRQSIVPTFFSFEKEYTARDLFGNLFGDEVLEDKAVAALLGYPDLKDAF